VTEAGAGTVAVQAVLVKDKKTICVEYLYTKIRKTYLFTILCHFFTILIRI